VSLQNLFPKVIISCNEVLRSLSTLHLSLFDPLSFASQDDVTAITIPDPI
jgi:hypothetical protein